MNPALRPTAVSRAAAFWPPVLLVLAGLVAYANSFRGPFVFDDLPSITENTTIRQFSTALTPPHNGSSAQGRPLVNLSFAVNYAIGGYDPLSYHIANLSIHLLAAVTLYGVVRRTLARVPAGASVSGASAGTSAEPPPGGPRTTRWQSLPKAQALATVGASDPHGMNATAARLVATGAALLWTVHPLQTESVTFVVQRTESLMALFLLLTFYAFIRATAASVGRAWPVVAVLACLAGMACKEVMVVAPLLVLLYDRTFVGGSFAAAWRDRKWLHLALAATWIPLGWLVATSGGDRGGTSGVFADSVTPWNYLLTQCEAIARYLKLAFWPHPLVIDYGAGIVTTLRDVLPQALLLVALAAGGAIAVWRKPAWGFLAAWFFAILAPSSSILPLTTQPIAEHRMYLPLAALTTAAVLGLHAWLRTRSLVVVAAVAVVFIGMTLRRNQDYASGITLWTDTVRKAPLGGRAHNNLGKAFWDARRFDEALACLLESQRLNPAAPDTQANLGRSYERAGKHDLAEAHYREAIRLQPAHVAARVNLGALLVDARRLTEALAFLEETVRLLPNYADTHLNLGVCLLELRRPADAIAPLQRAVQLAPANPDAHGNLANALALSARHDEAVAHYETALRLNADYAIAHENFGLLLLKLGRASDAVTHFEAAVRLNPDNPLSRTRLDYAREEASRTAKPPGP